MAFNANTDTNYALVLAAGVGLNGPDLDNFKNLLIANFCLQCTNGATLVNNTSMTNILALIKQSLQSKQYQF